MEAARKRSLLPAQCHLDAQADAPAEVELAEGRPGGRGRLRRGETSTSHITRRYMVYYIIILL